MVIVMFHYYCESENVINLVCLIVTIQFYQLIKQLMSESFYSYYFFFLQKFFFKFNNHLFFVNLWLSQEVLMNKSFYLLNKN